MASSTERGVLNDLLASQLGEAKVISAQLRERYEHIGATLVKLEALEEPTASRFLRRTQRALVRGKIAALRAEELELA
jgi:hypothetical protein